MCLGGDHMPWRSLLSFLSSLSLCMTGCAIATATPMPVAMAMMTSSLMLIIPLPLNLLLFRPLWVPREHSLVGERLVLSHALLSLGHSEPPEEE